MNAPMGNSGARGEAHAEQAGACWRRLRPSSAAMLDRLDRGIAEGSLESLLPDGRARLLGGRAPAVLPRSSIFAAGGRCCGSR